MKCTLILPIPPSANRYWRKTKFGRLYVSKEATDYKALVALRGMAAGIRPTDEPVKMSVWCFGLRKNRDLGNTNKVLDDALEGVAFHDDNQIVEFHYYRAAGKHAEYGKCIVVRIETCQHFDTS